MMALAYAVMMLSSLVLSLCWRLHGNGVGVSFGVSAAVSVGVGLVIEGGGLGGEGSVVIVEAGAYVVGGRADEEGWTWM